MSEYNKQNESDIFSEPQKKLTAKVKHAEDFKRQMTALIIAAVAVLIGVIVILLIKALPGRNRPINISGDEASQTAADSTETAENEVLYEGEVIGPQNRIFIMEYLTNDNISEIKIHNEYGDWGVFYNAQDENYYLTDNVNASYDREVMQNLLSAAGYTLAMERIAVDTVDFSEYGLSEEDDPAWYEITDRKGNTHKLYIGNIIPSNAGYYVRYEGRNAVYVLDRSISSTLLAPIETIISPLLAFPLGQSTYYMVTNLILAKDSEVFIAMEYIPEEEQSTDGSSAVHRLLYPEGYTPNDSNYMSIFALFQEYSGTYTIKYQPTEEDLEKYGLANPKYELYFEYLGFPTDIWFSEKNDNGNYYAYSPIFDIITEVEYDNAKWLEWNLLEWLQRSIFQQNIRSVEEIVIESEDAKYNFKLSFNADGLSGVVETNSGKNITDLDNFKQFYMTLLMTSFLDYADLDDSQIQTLTEKDEYLKLTVNMTDGKDLEYKFYPYETRKSFYTVNGIGHFYVVRDRMVKIIDDAERVLSGERVFADANN